MGKISFLLVVAILSLFFLKDHINASILDTILELQIAVEKQTGRGKDYDINFSGWVGSLRFDLADKKIYIAEFGEGDNKINVIIGIYHITRFDRHSRSIDFDCIDYQTGVEWRGKIWLPENSLKPNVEIITKHSPRKWVNLSEYGKRFMKMNNIDHLNLGL